MTKEKQETTDIQVGGNGIRGRLLAATLLSGLLVFGVGGWAAQAKLAGAVIAQGELAVSGEIKQVQHVDGGTVVELPVASGDFVKKGDVVLRLDETQLKVEFGIIENQTMQLSAMRERLTAERDDRQILDFSDLGVSGDIRNEEFKLFRENRELRLNQKEQLRLQAEQLGNQIKGLQEMQKANLAEFELLEGEIAVQERLIAKGLAKTTELRDFKRQVVRIHGALGDIDAKIAEARGQVSELETKLVAIDQNTRSEAQKEILSVDARLAELQQRRIAIAHRLDRTTVRAPESGYIYDVQAHTIGGVVAPGQTIMALVPEKRELQIHVKVAPTDIDRVAVNQTARLRFVAFNQQTTPEIRGTVDLVAAATTTDNATGLPFYKTNVAFKPSELGPLAGKLQPGMPVEIYIETEERTVVSYLTKPLRDQVLRAFREE